MAEEQYFDEWDEGTNIPWWREGRKKLNVVIGRVNEWTLRGRSKAKADTVLRHIDMGLQTFSTRDGGSEWAEALKEMRAYVTGSEKDV